VPSHTAPPVSVSDRRPRRTDVAAPSPADPLAHWSLRVAVPEVGRSAAPREKLTADARGGLLTEISYSEQAKRARGLNSRTEVERRPVKVTALLRHSSHLLHVRDTEAYTSSSAAARRRSVRHAVLHSSDAAATVGPHTAAAATTTGGGAFTDCMRQAPRRTAPPECRTFAAGHLPPSTQKNSTIADICYSAP